MSNIAPSTVIKILKKVPLDNTYEHTLWFATRQDQEAYFTGSNIVKYTLTEYTYQRLQRATIRVGIPADNLYDCNYLMYQNTAYGNKWFYAFITAVEYINNTVSSIEFEIDVMQTWMFETGTIVSYVERQHTATDVIGDNLEPEPFNITDVVFNDDAHFPDGTATSIPDTNYQPLTTLSALAVIIAIVDTEGTAVNGHNYDGIYGGAELWAYHVNDTTAINDKLAQYVYKPDSIVAMYTVPSSFVSSTILTGDHLVPNSAQGYTSLISRPAISTSNKLDGYRPRNNKMYTYPFNYLHIGNNGQELSVRYEYFNNLTPMFILRGTILSPVEAIIEPTNYRGVLYSSLTESYPSLHNERLTIKEYPMCSWNTDAYKAWLAQNGINIGAKALGGVAQTLVEYQVASSGKLGKKMSAIAGGELVTGLSSNLISGVTDAVGGGITAGIAADISKGSFDSANVECAHGIHNFYIGRVSVNRTVAQMIDNYFTRFGYARNKLEYIDTHSRPHWNYVKTHECTIEASIPADDANQIASIYDTGITFWKNASDIGYYNLDNRPV